MMENLGAICEQICGDAKWDAVRTQFEPHKTTIFMIFWVSAKNHEMTRYKSMKSTNGWSGHAIAATKNWYRMKT